MPPQPVDHQVSLALIELAKAFIPVIVSSIAAWFAYKASVNTKVAVEVSKKTEENTNHMKDELVALTSKAAHAEGVLAGRAMEQESGEK